MRKTLLILYREYHHYRDKLFEKLSLNFDLTIVHEGPTLYKTVNSSFDFQELIISNKSFGPFFYRKEVLSLLKQDYDHTIILSDLRYLDTVFYFLLKRRKSEITLWGHWYTKSKCANYVRTFFSKICFSNIFYDQVTCDQFIARGVDPDKCYVANNTIHTPGINIQNSDVKKSSIIAIGSLHARKQHHVLIKSFLRIQDQIPGHITLHFVGNGNQKEYLTELSENSDRITFHSHTNDEMRITDIYKSAICHVSYGQAGLSVLQSFGYGVPFITTKTAITGGELNNIADGFNGFILDDNESSLDQILIDLCNSPEFVEKLGHNAFEYYNQRCTMDNMVKGFIDAVELN